MDDSADETARAPQIDSDGKGEPAPLFPLGWLERCWFAWVTVGIPAISFGFSTAGLDLVEWKDPSPTTWPALFLDQAGTGPFLPFVVPVILVCLGIVLRPGPWVRRFPVRLILAFGSLLAIQYGAVVLAFFVFEHQRGGVAAVVWVTVLFVSSAEASVWLVRLFRWLVDRLRGRFGPRALRRLAGGVALASWVASVIWLRFADSDSSILVAAWQGPMALFGFFFLASLVLGPVWSCLALFRMQRRLGRPDPPSLARIGTALAGVGAYLFAWRVAFLDVMRAYEALPDQMPDCFVATAAAQGPRRLIGAETVRLGDGRRLRITPQLRRLKLFDLALRTLAPGIHRALRRLYDRLGPLLAARIRTPLRAAAAWLLLKPAEGLAVLLLHWLVGAEARALRSRLYRSRAEDRSNPGLR